MSIFYHFFWGGPFSNWHPCKFVSGFNYDANGVCTWGKVDSKDPFTQYNCAEQYMMAQKALISNDISAYAEIMASDSPREQKALGRKIQNFNHVVWDKVKKQVVMYGCYAKFAQNEDLKQQLLATDNKILVEASPYDRIWGIGFTEAEALANKNKWGENLLGKVLMDVRFYIKDLKDKYAN